MIKTDKVIRPIVILDPSKISHRKEGKKNGRKTKKGETTTDKL